ncbi:hypothetical protein [Mesorhizobium sp. M0019]|uniref:hypothetical protein n=1 Tax=Mesorhizobium sp. M0019 TaxID=2956845 RepID=UPI0033358B54
MPATSKPTAASLAEAATWLAQTPRAERGGAAIPQLQRRFGLTLEQALDVVRQNNLRLARAA